MSGRQHEDPRQFGRSGRVRFFMTTALASAGVTNRRRASVSPARRDLLGVLLMLAASHASSKKHNYPFLKRTQ